MNNYKTELIPMTDIFSDDDFNCRGKIVPLDVIDLARDIQDNGLDIPIVVQPYDEHPPQKYRIIAGHRRFMAFRVNKATEIPCQIRQDLDELHAAAFNLRENLTRQQLNIKQEAHGLRRFYHAGWTDKATADLLHQSRGWVQVRYMLLALPEDIQNEAAAGMINQEHVRKLFGMKTEEMYQLVRKIKESKIKGEKIELPVEKKKDPNARLKKSRERYDIFSMIDWLLTTVGAGLHTRGMAWAAGEISDYEFLEDVERHCDENGLTFHHPSFIEQRQEVAA